MPAVARIAERRYSCRSCVPAMNSEASTSATTTRWLSLSALLQVLPAPTATRCQNAAESGWKFLHAMSRSDVWSAASIWTLAQSEAISSIAASRTCSYKDSGVDSEIRRVLIDWSVLAHATSCASRYSLCRSAASACLALVVSRAILEHPIILPVGSRNGEIVRETSMRSPAFVTRTVS